MATTVDDLLPTAKDLMKKLALAEAEKAAESARRHAAGPTAPPAPGGDGARSVLF